MVNFPDGNRFNYMYNEKDIFRYLSEKVGENIDKPEMDRRIISKELYELLNLDASGKPLYQNWDIYKQIKARIKQRAWYDSSKTKLYNKDKMIKCPAKDNSKKASKQGPWWEEREIRKRPFQRLMEMSIMSKDDRRAAKQLNDSKLPFKEQIEFWLLRMTNRTIFGKPIKPIDSIQRFLSYIGKI